MNTEELFTRLKNELDSKLHFLEDKPEETVDSTLKACWFTAFGAPKSAEEAAKYPLPELTGGQIKILNQLIDQRLKKTPLAHITGRQSFMGIELLADSRALIPRKETEILGRKILDTSSSLSERKQFIRIMDICCGAGNLGLAVAFYNSNVKVFATDISDEAVELTKENISLLNLGNRVEVKQGDLFSALKQMNIMERPISSICNPPYISSAKVTKMNTEILAMSLYLHLTEVCLELK